MPSSNNDTASDELPSSSPSIAQGSSSNQRRSLGQRLLSDFFSRVSSFPEASTSSVCTETQPSSSVSGSSIRKTTSTLKKGERRKLDESPEGKSKRNKQENSDGFSTLYKENKTFELGLKFYKGAPILNLFMARRMFLEAVEANPPDKKAFFYLAKMYFYGQGGSVELEKAYELLKKIDISNMRYVPAEQRGEGYYMLAAYHFLRFQLYEFQGNQEEKNKAENEIIVELRKAAEEGHEKSIYMLFILLEKQSQSALQLLKEFYQKFYQKTTEEALETALNNISYLPFHQTDRRNYYFKILDLFNEKNIEITEEDKAALDEYNRGMEISKTKGDPLPMWNPENLSGFDKLKDFFKNYAARNNMAEYIKVCGFLVGFDLISDFINRVNSVDESQENVAIKIKELLNFITELNTILDQISRQNIIRYRQYLLNLRNDLEINRKIDRQEAIVRIKNIKDSLNKKLTLAARHIQDYLFIKVREMAVQANRVQAQEATEVLVKWYENNNKINYLITSYCYELNKAKGNLEFPICKFLENLINQVSPEKYQEYFIPRSMSTIFSKLEKLEQQSGTYFQENVSDDSDSEAEDVYQENSKKRSRSTNLSDDIAGLLRNKTRDMLKAIETIDEKDVYDSKRVEAKRNRILSTFNDLFNKNPPRKIKVHVDAHKETTNGRRKTIGESKKTAEDDLLVINFYNARGELAEGLAKVSTDFRVVLFRGLHMQPHVWSAKIRREYRRLSRSGDHPLTKVPIYSHAVYEVAGITDFSDITPLTQEKLALAARFIQHRLKALREDEKLYDKEEIKSEYSFSKRSDQVQNLYSNQYTDFHNFLAIQVRDKKEDAFFVSTANPFVSLGPVEAKHAARYPFGTKYYVDQADSRLRPCWDNSLRALRPYSGVILASVHTLEDFARGNVNYVPGMNLQGKIVIDQRIIPEKEITIDSLVAPADGVGLIEVAKYPSFNTEYQPTFLHNYGLDKATYEKFKELFEKSKPHSALRRLVTLLLGEHLSAYATLYLWDAVHQDKLVKKGQVMLYLDPYGNFSLKPCYDIDPFPRGQDADSVLTQLFSQSLRKKNGINKLPPENEELDEGNDMQSDVPLPDSHNSHSAPSSPQ